MANVCAASVAHAADLAPTKSDPIDNLANSLSAFGLTFYGTVDAGLSYQEHGLPSSPVMPSSTDELITKFNNRPSFGLTSNGLGFSQIGVKGQAPLTSDLSAVFQLDTGFQPTGGALTDGQGSIAANNGRPVASYTGLGDSTRAGQAINGRAFVGLNSQTFGTLTFGRNTTLQHDRVCEYDSLSCAPSFSYVGFFGGAAGIGDTENRFLDDTLKYNFNYGPFHVGALYQFANMPDISGEKTIGDAYQIDLGGTYQGFSVDALIARKHDGIFVGTPLSAAQVGSLLNPASPYFGLPVSKTVQGVVSDNTGFTVLTKYEIGQAKFYLSYENIVQTNPSDPLAIGTQNIGGYSIIPFNASFPHPKSTQIIWGGAKYAFSPSMDFMVGYYHAWNNSYGITPCSNASSAQCSGQYDVAGGLVDYKFNKHFDVYGGLVWSQASNGFANGYIQTSNVSVMSGARFQF